MSAKPLPQTAARYEVSPVGRLGQMILSLVAGGIVTGALPTYRQGPRATRPIVRSQPVRTS